MPETTKGYDRLRAVLALDLSNPRSKLVLVALVLHADARGRCWPSLETIARYVGCDVRTVRRLLRALERDGHLHVEGRRRSNGKVTTNLYTVLVSPADTALSDGAAQPADTALSGGPSDISASPADTALSPELPERERPPLERPDRADARTTDHDERSRSRPQLDHFEAPAKPSSSAAMNGQSGPADTALSGGREVALRMVPWEVLTDVLSMEQLYALGFDFNPGAVPPTLIDKPEWWQGHTLNGRARSPLYRTTLRRQAERVRDAIEAA